MGNQGRQGEFFNNNNYPQGWKRNQNQSFWWNQDVGSPSKQQALFNNNNNYILQLRREQANMRIPWGNLCKHHYPTRRILMLQLEVWRHKWDKLQSSWRTPRMVNLQPTHKQMPMSNVSQLLLEME